MVMAHKMTDDLPTIYTPTQFNTQQMTITPILTPAMPPLLSGMMFYTYYAVRLG